MTKENFKLITEVLKLIGLIAVLVVLIKEILEEFI